MKKEVHYWTKVLPQKSSEQEKRNAQRTGNDKKS